MESLVTCSTNIDPNKIKTKLKIVQRLNSEVDFRQKEYDGHTIKLNHLLDESADAYDIKKIREFVEESENALKVTIKALERACHEAEEFLQRYCTTELITKAYKGVCNNTQDKMNENIDGTKKTQVIPTNDECLLLSEIHNLLLALQVASNLVPSLKNSLRLTHGDVTHGHNLQKKDDSEDESV